MQIENELKLTINYKSATVASFTCATDSHFSYRAVKQEADESALKTLLDTLLQMKVLTS